MIPKVLAKLYAEFDKIARGAGILAGKSGRHMKFPYTISAKIAQFPIFFYTQHNNIWMYWPVGIVIGFIVFRKIHVLANSEANQRAWAATQRKNAEKEAEHH